MFSIVLNNSLASVTSIQDRIAIALAAYSETTGSAAARTAPVAPSAAEAPKAPDGLEVLLGQAERLLRRSQPVGWPARSAAPPETTSVSGDVPPAQRRPRS